jgi:HD superfamily phosphohydrolase
VSILGINPVALLVAPREINSTLDEKNSALIDANKQIEILRSENAALTPFKEAYEEAERKKADDQRKQDIADLRQYVIDSKAFSADELKSDELNTRIDNLEVSGLKNEIADRLVAKEAKNRKPETASAKPQPKPKADINISDSQTPGKTLMDWLNK